AKCVNSQMKGHMLMRNLILQTILSCGVLILVSSCGKKSQPADQNSLAQSPTDPLLVSPSPFSRPTAPAMAVQSVAVPDDATAALGVLTQAVRKFSAERRRVPANLDEVIRAGYIQNVPQPPAGKKFFLDTKRLEVTLANK
ncbi:MAG: hypothetical protein ABIP71_06845, partial [Verrucomicrobiota bacterium]